MTDRRLSAFLSRNYLRKGKSRVVDERECCERKNAFLNQRNYRTIFTFGRLVGIILEGGKTIDSKIRGLISGAMMK